MAQSAQDVITQNNQMRGALLATAPRMRKKLGKFGPFAPGDNFRQKLFNVGIGTSLDCIVEATVAESVTLVPSIRAPFNLISNVKLTDYDGTDRVNCSGFQLFLNRTVMMAANGRAGYSHLLKGSAQIDPTYPWPASPTAAGTLKFPIEVPMAYNPESDLRGAMLMQTATGEAYLSMDFNASDVGTDDDSVYSGGTGAISAIYVTVYQNYLSPLAIGNTVPLPQLDLTTVYELNGSLKSSDSIAANVDKLLNYPNVRTVLGTYLEYVNNGAMAAGSVNYIDMIANGNTTLQAWGEDDLAFNIRKQLGCDLPAGCYYITSRSRPIETAQYGNVQLAFNPSAVSAGNTYAGVMFEAFYPKGSTLPGMTQG